MIFSPNRTNVRGHDPKLRDHSVQGGVLHVAIPQSKETDGPGTSEHKQKKRCPGKVCITPKQSVSYVVHVFSSDVPQLFWDRFVCIYKSNEDIFWYKTLTLYLLSGLFWWAAVLVMMLTTKKKVIIKVKERTALNSFKVSNVRTIIWSKLSQTFSPSILNCALILLTHVGFCSSFSSDSAAQPSYSNVR